MYIDKILFHELNRTILRWRINFRRVVQWVDDSTKIFDHIQLFEETISYHIGHPPVETL